MKRFILSVFALCALAGCGSKNDSAYVDAKFTCTGMDVELKKTGDIEISSASKVLVKGTYKVIEGNLYEISQEGEDEKGKFALIDSIFTPVYDSVKTVKDLEDSSNLYNFGCKVAK